ncbi:MAG: signal peptidase II [Chitinophagales bacterium]
MARKLLIILIILMNIGCDQVAKRFVRKHIDANESIHFLSDHFTITRVENAGAFLSFGDHLPARSRNILLAVLPMVALMFGLAYVLVKRNLPLVSAIGISCILGGGLGNIYDRIAHGAVTDFFHINFGIFQTGIFNMADLSITAGALILLVQPLVRIATGKQV